jgi:hypothetical protein
MSKTLAFSMSVRPRRSFAILRSGLILLLLLSLLSACDIGLDHQLVVDARAKLEIEQRTLAALDKAISALSAAPGDWQQAASTAAADISKSAQDVIDKAEAAGEKLSSHVADVALNLAQELQRLAKESVSYLGDEIKCTTDFMGHRVKETLEYFVAMIKGEPTPPKSAWLCHVEPAIIKLEQAGDGRWVFIQGHPHIVRVLGFNFSYLGLPRLELHDANNNKVRDAKFAPEFITPYSIHLNFESEDFSDVQASWRYTLVWSAPSSDPGNSVSVEKAPTVTPTPLPPPAPELVSWRLQPIGKQMQFMETGAFHVDCVPPDAKQDRHMDCGPHVVRVPDGWQLDKDHVGQVNAPKGIRGNFPTPAQGFNENAFDVNNSANKTWREIKYWPDDANPLGIEVKGWSETHCKTKIAGKCVDRIRNWWKADYIVWGKRIVNDVPGEVIGGGACPTAGPPHVCGVYPPDQLARFINATPDKYLVWITLQVPPGGPGPEIQRELGIGQSTEIDTTSGKVTVSIEGNQLVVRYP